MSGLGQLKAMIFALGDLDFSWNESTAKTVIELWNDGQPIWEISKQTRPANRFKDIDDAQFEVMVLLMHLIREGRISMREGGILGG